ncbi:cupin domain-containing protein [Microlunatus elymi]|uniref:Cupin domain-containing protein n=1 Tax=Microlunatus elymi TaxID=2596828 RepID=A0A516Q3G4_9ACTN|nr:cupin domain-containing protein [Microlunatus elymi]QDP97977.1 cupin domain-containing protein [Microlunatus elymi]
MPGTNREDAAVGVDTDEIEGRYAELGDYTVGFERFPLDIDPARYFVGLPGDRCGCPHWGQVTTGRITFRWLDHEETFVAGDVYYAPPGHLPLITAGTAVIEFSPTAELQRTLEVVGTNMTGASA